MFNKTNSISDLVELHASIFKYADDGSVAITYKDP